MTQCRTLLVKEHISSVCNIGLRNDTEVSWQWQLGLSFKGADADRHEHATAAAGEEAA